MWSRKNSSVKQHFATNSLKPHEGETTPCVMLGTPDLFLDLELAIIFCFFNAGVSTSLLYLGASGQNQSRDKTEKKPRRSNH